MQKINGYNITQRKPGHPGALLRRNFMEPNNMKPGELAKAIKMSRQQVSALVNERANMSPNMAVRLARYFGTSVEMWMNMQIRLDLWHTVNGEDAADIEQIEPLKAVA